MRIREVEIEHFGMLHGLRLELPGDLPHVVFGPNEAGKSTLLQVIRELLFGFPTRNRYAFEDHAGEMAATAMLELANGGHLRFRRRKGRSNVVVGEHVENGDPVDAASLTRYLGNANIDLYQNVFGFALEELASGQQSLEDARLSEALYGTAMGGLAGFQDVLRGLQDDQERLFSPSARKKPVNQLLSELQKYSKELRAAQVRPREYADRQQAFQQLLAQSDQLRQELGSLQRQVTRGEQLAKAIDLWRQRTVLKEELAELVVPQTFPRDGEQQFDKCRGDLARTENELTECTRDLEEITTQLASLAPQPEVIERAADIQHLAQQLEKIRGFRNDIGPRQHDLQAAQRTVTALMHELDPAWSEADLKRFDFGIARRTAITALIEEVDSLEQRKGKLADQRPLLEEDIAELQRQLAALPKDSDMAPLRELVEAVGEYEKRQEKLEEYEMHLRELAAKTAAVQQQLSSPFALPTDITPGMPVPMPATLAKFRDEHEALAKQGEIKDRQIAEAERELRASEAEFATLRADQQVPDQVELQQVRDHRDQGWKLIRRKFVELNAVTDEQLQQWHSDADTPLVEAYEWSVQQADRVADQRQQQAEMVARMEQLGRQIERLTRLHQQAQDARAMHANKVKAWEQRWHQLWQASGIAPDEPEPMAEWLERYRQLTELLAQQEAIHGHVNVQRKWLEDYHTRLRAVVDVDAATSAQLVAEAHRRFRVAQEIAAERKSLAAQLPRKQRQLAELENGLTDLNQRIELWKEQWKPLMTEVGFPTSWDASLVTNVLNGLSEARLQQEKAESLALRVADMQRGIEQFEEAVATLCQALAPDRQSLPPEHVVEDLVKLLDQTRQDLRDQESLQQQRAKLESRRADRERQRQNDQKALQRWLKLAEVDDADHLPEQARRVQHWYATKEQIESIEQQLRTIRGTEDAEQFEAALQAADAVELEAQQRVIEAELKQISDQFDAALEKQGAARQQLDELDQAGQAVEIAQQIESTRSQLVAAAEHWVPLVMARTVLRRAIDRFQREHQPQLLVDIGQLLNRMTLGRYTEIVAKLDQQGSLQVRQADGQTKDPAQLSTGTREQLYLAIRLAYVRHYCRGSEPLPVVMDDVLVNFDDERAAATWETLVELSEQVQVILLTCHQHTLELARGTTVELQPITSLADRVRDIAQPSG